MTPDDLGLILLTASSIGKCLSPACRRWWAKRPGYCRWAPWLCYN